MRWHDVNWYLRDRNRGVVSGRKEAYLNHRLLEWLLSERLGVNDAFSRSAHRR